MRIIASALTCLLLLVGLASSAAALDLTQRKVSVDGNLNVNSATKIAEKLIAFDARAEAPITMMITATSGSAQGVQLIADTIRSLKSPVVAAVITQVHSAGAALAPFADRVLVYPSAGFVFTELTYEGVKKPEPPRPAAPAPAAGMTEPPKSEPEPEPEQVLLQAARKAYLERFNARLAKRIRWSPKKLAKKIAAGGFVVTAEDAVRQKIADEVVEYITYTELPETKRELKVITTDKRSRPVPRD